MKNLQTTVFCDALCQKCSINFFDYVNNDAGNLTKICDSTPNTKIRKACKELSVTPIIVSKKDNKRVKERKLTKQSGKIRRCIFKSHNVAESDSMPVLALTTSDMSEYFDKLKNKLINASYKEKVQILTLAPSSWSIVQCASFFGVSEYMVRKARL